MGGLALECSIEFAPDEDGEASEIEPKDEDRDSGERSINLAVRPEARRVLGEIERSDPDDVAQIAVGALSAQQAIEVLSEVVPPDQAEVVLLRVVADLSAEEVARVMGRSPGSVRVLQPRALRKLAKHFQREDVTN